VQVVFWGSPRFAVPTLKALIDSHHSVAAVVTQPDRRRGRGGSVSPTPVAQVAAIATIPVLKPDKPRGESFVASLTDVAPDVFVVAAYGEILRPEVLALPPRGAFNVHASLLPAYRGAAPVTRAILDGCDSTGITIMRMEAGLDTGPICLQAEEPIHADDSAGTVTERLAALGATVMVDALGRLEAGTLTETPQDDALASYAIKVTAEDAHLDWSAGVESLERAARAYDPWPGAWTTWRGERLKVFRLRPIAETESAPAGAVVHVDPEPVVVAGDGLVVLDVVQPAGRERMSGSEWARGRMLAAGERLGEDA
jgi:methionyl-tRNA formyltransferase